MLELVLLRERELLRLRGEERRDLVPPLVDVGLVVRRRVVVFRLLVRALLFLVVVFFLAIWVLLKILYRLDSEFQDSWPLGYRFKSRVYSSDVPERAL
jgi:hypothetical protein